MAHSIGPLTHQLIGVNGGGFALPALPFDVGLSGLNTILRLKDFKLT